MEQFDDGYFEQAELVPSRKYKGFLTCSKCEKPIIEPWSEQIKVWRFCPYCGRSIKRGKNERPNH